MNYITIFVKPIRKQALGHPKKSVTMSFYPFFPLLELSSLIFFQNQNFIIVPFVHFNKHKDNNNLV
jgi:hypothetical protein